MEAIDCESVAIRCASYRSLYRIWTRTPAMALVVLYHSKLYLALEIQRLFCEYVGGCMEDKLLYINCTVILCIVPLGHHALQKIGYDNEYF